MSYNTLEKRLGEYQKDAKTKINKKMELAKPSNVCEKKKLTQYDKAAYGMLYGMVSNKKYLDEFKNAALYFVDAPYRYLLTEIEYYYKKYTTIEIADFYTYLMDKEDILELFKNIVSYIDNDIINDEAINDFMKVIKDYNVRLEINRLKDLMKNTYDELEKAKILEKIKLLRIGE